MAQPTVFTTFLVLILFVPATYLLLKSKMQSKLIISISNVFIGGSVWSFLSFIQYLIFSLVIVTNYNFKIKESFNLLLKYKILFIFLTTFIFFLFHPNYWENPFKVFDAIDPSLNTGTPSQGIPKIK